MIEVALLSVIRSWHFRKGMSFREISRRTGLSRNTVKKYLKTSMVEPILSKRERLSLLDDYEQTLITWLHRESKRTRKQRQTLKQLYQSLILLGYTGSYDRVAAFARQWRQQQQRGPSLQVDEANCTLPMLNSAIVGCFTFVPTDRKAMKCSLMLITERLRPLAVYLNEVFTTT